MWLAFGALPALAEAPVDLVEIYCLSAKLEERAQYARAVGFAELDSGEPRVPTTGLLDVRDRLPRRLG